MKFYATLNQNKICTGISQLSGEVLQDDMIEISSANATYMWKKFDLGVWSVGTFEPISTAPISEFETLQAQQRYQIGRLEQIELDNGAFQDFILSVLPQ